MKFTNLLAIAGALGVALPSYGGFPRERVSPSSTNDDEETIRLAQEKRERRAAKRLIEKKEK